MVNAQSFWRSVGVKRLKSPSSFSRMEVLGGVDSRSAACVGLEVSGNFQLYRNAIEESEPSIHHMYSLELIIWRSMSGTSLYVPTSGTRVAPVAAAIPRARPNS